LLRELGGGSSDLEMAFDRRHNAGVVLLCGRGTQREGSEVKDERAADGHHRKVDSGVSGTKPTTRDALPTFVGLGCIT